MGKKERIEFLERKIYDLEQQLEEEKDDCLPCIENILTQIRKYQWILIEEREKEKRKGRVELISV